MSDPSVQEVSLLHLLSFIVDNRGRTCPVVDQGFPLIATNSVTDASRRAFPKDVRYVTQETYDNWFRAHPKPNDILFVCKGTPGKVALVPDPVPYCIAQDMVALRADTTKVDPLYLYYRLTAPDVRERIEALHVGTLIPHFKKGDFDKLRFLVHSLGDQRRIAAVLGSFDDLIEAEERAASRSDELWRLMLASELRDTRSVPLSSLASFVNGKNFTNGAGTDGTPVIRTPEVRNGPTASTVRNDCAASAENVANPGDILFVWSGSLVVSRWRWQPGLVNQHIFKVIPNQGVPGWLVQHAIETLMVDFLGIAADKATTMGHIKRADLDRVVEIPRPSQWAPLDAMIRPLWDEALSARMHASRLTATRDELLPLLMSGKVRVSEDRAVA